MATHAHDFGRASALPLCAVLGAIPSYPRPVIERLVARLIDHLDEQDGDPDLEPTGDEFEDDDPAECNGDREPDCVEARTAYVAARVRKVPTIHFMQHGGRRWRIENL